MQISYATSAMQEPRVNPQDPGLLTPRLPHTEEPHIQVMTRFLYATIEQFKKRKKFQIKISLPIKVQVAIYADN